MTNSIDILPVNQGPDRCGTCWTPPGQHHELSCEQVSPGQFWAYCDAKRAEWQLEVRRYHRNTVAAGWLIAVALLGAVAFVWVVAS